MRWYAWMCLLCLVVIATPADALCHWDVEVPPPSGLSQCSGVLDSVRDPWPRLPTDSEIQRAREDYLAFLSEGDTQTRIDNVQVVKFHTCEGNWVNHVEMKVDWSWYWSSAYEPDNGEWKPQTSYTFMIYNPGRDTFEFVNTFTLGLYFLNMYGETYSGFETGVCSGGGTSGGSGGTSSSSGGSEGDDVPWIIIVGALVVIGAGAAIGAKILGKPKEKVVAPVPAVKPPEKKEKKKEKEQVRYILQLSANKVSISPDAPQKVKITVWKQVGDATPVQAPEASIQLVPPGDAPGLLVTPVEGKGSLESTFSIKKEGQEGGKGPQSLKVSVTASADGIGTQTDIEVELTGAYSIEFY